MDAPLDPRTERTDKVLCELFHAAGPLEAPVGMDARIMQRIALTPVAPVVVAAPLLPKWTWLLGAALIAAVLYVAFTTTGSSNSTWVQRIPYFDLGAVLASKWVLSGLVVVGALLALEAWLVTRPRSGALLRSE